MAMVAECVVVLLDAESEADVMEEREVVEPKVVEAAPDVGFEAEAGGDTDDVEDVEAELLPWSSTSAV